MGIARRLGALLYSARVEKLSDRENAAHSIETLRREIDHHNYRYYVLDDCWGMAAQLSFYFLQASFPFLIFLSALIGFIPYVPDHCVPFIGAFLR
ncbi:MAG: hypothetical protein P8Y94_00420 [Acidobacteriota bacterium]